MTKSTRRPTREVLHRALAILAALQEDDCARDELIVHVQAKLDKVQEAVYA